MKSFGELDALRAEVRKYRGLVFAARPTHWVRTHDLAAARGWESACAAVLELDAEGSGPSSFADEASEYTTLVVKQVLAEEHRRSVRRECIAGAVFGVLMGLCFAVGRYLR